MQRGLPLFSVQRELDIHGRGHPIVEFPFPIPGQNDLVDPRRLGQADLHPLVLALARHPTVRVAEQPVVEMGDLVNGHAGDAGRGRRLGAQGSQSNVLARWLIEDLDLVKAGLPAVSAENRDANVRGRLGDKRQHVGPLWRQDDKFLARPGSHRVQQHTPQEQGNTLRHPVTRDHYVLLQQLGVWGTRGAQLAS